MTEMKKRLSVIPLTKESSTIMEKDSFRELFERDRLEESGIKDIEDRFQQIEESNVEAVLSQGLKELYLDVKNNCSLFVKKVVSQKVKEIERRISISPFDPSRKIGKNCDDEQFRNIATVSTAVDENIKDTNF